MNTPLKRRRHDDPLCAAIIANETTIVSLFEPSEHLLLAIAGALKKTTSVTHVFINFRWQVHPDEVMFVFANTLRINTSIKSINLFQTIFSWQILQALGDALAQNTSVTILQLYITHRSHANVEALAAIQNSLVRNRLLVVDALFHPNSTLRRLPVELYERIMCLALYPFTTDDVGHFTSYLDRQLAGVKRESSKP